MAPPCLWLFDDQELDSGAPILKVGFQVAAVGGHDRNALEYVGDDDGDGDEYGDHDCMKWFRARLGEPKSTIDNSGSERIRRSGWQNAWLRLCCFSFCRALEGAPIYTHYFS